MNKRIFSLVCIVLYALWLYQYTAPNRNMFIPLYDRSKKYGLRSRIIRVIKQIKRSNKKNGIKSKHETQLNNNNNNNDYDYDLDDYGDGYDEEKVGIAVVKDSGCCGCCG
ncbi:Plasmodium yoelii subtelomeric region (PYST-C1), putative [Plasmodium chabaudi adami]|uniref:Plasmodium yoelii subtelomeric region (PYST-C1), putative n=1 Tax=Plasmodium chabaudi adami TaxID=5826 RepID=A0A1C6WX24_PLACE|nr:Plasmodium yoelii subtelomeric region (PYST-C1), putative [Plasmodium chabaudi adami]